MKRSCLTLQSTDVVQLHRVAVAVLYEAGGETSRGLSGDWLMAMTPLQAVQLTVVSRAAIKMGTLLRRPIHVLSSNKTFI